MSTADPAEDPGTVLAVCHGEWSSEILTAPPYDYIGEWGVRPVVEVLASSINYAPEEGDWELTKDSGTAGLSVGDLIACKERPTEAFYVINVTENKVAMLAEGVLDETGISQDLDYWYGYKLEFATEDYWDPDGELSYPGENGKYPDLNDETTYPIGDATSIVTVAKEYGASLGATGRLMTVEEVVELGGDTTGGSMSVCPDFIKDCCYWLGSAKSPNDVWHVLGGDGYEGGRLSSYNTISGIRPVVEVSPSSIN